MHSNLLRPMLTNSLCPQTVIHQMITLKECQSQCIHKLGELRFDKTEEFFGSYFHYLQYGYHMCESLVPPSHNVGSDNRYVTAFS